MLLLFDTEKFPDGQGHNDFVLAYSSQAVRVFDKNSDLPYCSRRICDTSTKIAEMALLGLASGDAEEGCRL